MVRTVSVLCLGMGVMLGSAVAQTTSRSAIIAQPAMVAAPAANTTVTNDAASRTAVRSTPILIAQAAPLSGPIVITPTPRPRPIPPNPGCLGTQGGGTSRC